MSRHIAKFDAVPVEKMTDSQRATWESILERYCYGDDPVYIVGNGGCVRDEDSVKGGEYRIYCYSPGGPMAIGVTEEEFSRLPSAR